MKYLFTKDYTPWNKGKKMSEQMRHKISLSTQGLNNPRYIDGRAMRPYYCIDCGIQVSRGAKRCRKCLGKYYSKNFSKENNHRWKGGKITKKCLICNKIFLVQKCLYNFRKTCSRKCFSKYHSLNFRGESHPNWKGGITPLYRRLKQCNAYYQWRKDILERDNGFCQRCGSNKNLEVHHIKPFFKYIELRYDTNNGIVLCKDCHKLEPVGRKIVLLYNNEK